MVFENLIGTAKVNQFYGKCLELFRATPTKKKINKKELLDAGTHRMNLQNWVKSLFL